MSSIHCHVDYYFIFCLEFVTLMLGGGSEAENAKERLKEKLPIIKTIATEFKKINPEKS